MRVKDTSIWITLSYQHFATHQRRRCCYLMTSHASGTRSWAHASRASQRICNSIPAMSGCDSPCRSSTFQPMGIPVGRDSLSTSSLKLDAHTEKEWSKNGLTLTGSRPARRRWHQVFGMRPSVTIGARGTGARLSVWVRARFACSS